MLAVGDAATVVEGVGIGVTAGTRAAAITALLAAATELVAA